MTGSDVLLCAVRAQTRSLRSSRRRTWRTPRSASRPRWDIQADDVDGRRLRRPVIFQVRGTNWVIMVSMGGVHLATRWQAQAIRSGERQRCWCSTDGYVGLAAPTPPNNTAPPGTVHRIARLPAALAMKSCKAWNRCADRRCMASTPTAIAASTTTVPRHRDDRLAERPFGSGRTAGAIHRAIRHRYGSAPRRAHC